MLKDIDLRMLSEISDTKPSFLSIYLKAYSEPSRKFLDRRERECLSALKGNRELKQIFEKNMEKTREYLDSGGKSKKTKTFAIFSSGPKEFFEAYELPMEVEEMMIVDTSPYIRPIAMLREEWESFAIALLDYNNARLYLVTSSMISDAKKMHEDIMNKHKKGGWSQMRFQRLRKGAIDRFFKEVSDYLEGFIEKEDVRRIILAGPGNGKKEFLDYLPENLKEKVVAIMDMEFDVPEGELLRDSLEGFWKKEREEEREFIERLRAEILKGGLVTYGLSDTLKAVTEGRAMLLLISMGTKAKGWKCERCSITGPGTAGKCDNCGNPVFTVDVIEEMVEASESMGTTLEFIKENQFLDELGGVAAFLRF